MRGAGPVGHTRGGVATSMSEHHKALISVHGGYLRVSGIFQIAQLVGDNLHYEDIDPFSGEIGGW
jgi:hypothetical protein